MAGAPPIGQRLGDEVEYRPTDEGQGRDGWYLTLRQMFVWIFVRKQDDVTTITDTSCGSPDISIG